MLIVTYKMFWREVGEMPWWSWRMFCNSCTESEKYGKDATQGIHASGHEG
jgi:hypothetical protein